MNEQHKPIVLVVYLSKGGTAKSTLTALIAQHIDATGHSAVIVDFDRQGSQSTIFDLIDQNGRPYELLHQVLERKLNARDALVPVGDSMRIRPDGGSLYVIPGGPQTKLSIDRIVAEPLAYDMVSNLDLLAGPVEDLAGVADYVIVDMGPSDQQTSISALVTADWVVIPTTMDFLSVDRIGSVLREVSVTRRANPALQVAGIVSVMTQYYFGKLRRSKNMQAGETFLRKNYGDLLLKDDQGKPVDIPYHEDWRNVMWLGETIMSTSVNASCRSEALRFLRALSQRIGLGGGVS